MLEAAFGAGVMGRYQSGVAAAVPDRFDAGRWAARAVLAVARVLAFVSGSAVVLATLASAVNRPAIL